MPRTRKKVAGKSGASGGESRRPAPSPDPQRGVGRTGVRQSPDRGAQRKRGWRDIEAMSERARLKSLLSDIWHEDIEIEEDIFGESDHLAGYYTETEDAEVPLEPAEDDEFEEFEEDED